MVLLTDGSVVMETFDDIDTWVKLTPDAKGSYVNGTWSTLAKMRTPRLYFASQVMQNGKLWVMGGEYTGPFEDPSWGPEAEIYDPISNTWSDAATYPPQPSCAGIGDITITSNTQLTTGSPVITGVYSTTRILPGWSVATAGFNSGVVGIPANATVVSASGNQVVMSAPATATGSSIVQFSGVVQSCFGDDPSILLPGHNILAGNLLLPTTYLYSIDTNSFLQTGTKVYSDESSDEEGWAKLNDGSVLSYDLFHSIATGTGYAEKYDPSSGLWTSVSPAAGTASGTLPVLSDPQVGFELGPILRLQDGRVIVVGANQFTALYSPTNNRWAPGPQILANLTGPGGTLKNAPFGADDASAAILPNGHVILTADAGPNPVTLNGSTSSTSPTVTLSSTAGLQPGWPVVQSDGGHATIPRGAFIFSVDGPRTISLGGQGGKIDALANNPNIALVFGGIFSPPTQVFDFNPKARTMTAIPGPGSLLPQEPAFVTHMLMLPTGELLFSDSSNQLYVYNPDGVAQFGLLPEIESVRYDHQENIFTLTGKQLNGQSAGASYGDDAQMDENYPIVRLTDAITGNVFYCRTTNWSSTGVGASRGEPESVNFTLNPNVTPGFYALTVTGAGLSSFPKSVHISKEEVDDVKGTGDTTLAPAAMVQPQLSTGTTSKPHPHPIAIVHSKK